jgi:chloramphenicol 3-O phosphotransferase
MTTVILMMGISSSGKTTIANHLVELLADEYAIVGFDYAVEENLDKCYWPGGTLEKEGFCYFESEHGLQLEIGHVGREFLKNMLFDIINKAKSGCNLIVDSVLSDEEYATINRELADCHIMDVGLKPPLEKIIKRESQRGDRKIGLAKKTYDKFYEGKQFSLEINTFEVTPLQAAKLISNHVQKLNHSLSSKKSK